MKTYSSLSHFFATLVLVFAGVQIAMAQTDTTRPAVSNFSFTPTSVDVTAAAQTVTATIRLTDDLSGVSYASAIFRSPSGNQSAGVSWSSYDRTAGTALDGTYSGTFTIPRYAEGGDWKLEYLSVNDVVGNFQDYAPTNRTPQLPDLVIPAGTLETLAVTSQTDTTSPAVSNFSFTPTSVDVTAAAQTVTATIRLTDDLSGVSYASAIFRSPSGNQSAGVSWSSYDRTAGTALDGTYSGTFTIPRYAEGGDWKLEYLSVNDVVGNFQDYAPTNRTPQFSDLVIPAGTPETLSVNSTVAPLAMLNAATNVTFTEATISGTVNARGDPTSYYFQYGTSLGYLSYGLQTTANSAGNSSANVGVSASLASLSPDQTYYYRLTASNSFGSVYTNAGTFRTLANSTPTTLYDIFVSALPADQRGSNDDPDKDGIENLLEYIFGSDPTLPNSGLLPHITKAPGSSNLVFTYKRKIAATGVTQVIEHATNLSPPWTPAVHGASGVSITAAAVPGDATAEQVTVTIPSTSTSRFVRLKASR